MGEGIKMIEPLGVKDFEVELGKIGGTGDPTPLYDRLYLGLPREMRAALRRVAATGGPDEAIIVVKHTGEDVHRVLAADPYVMAAVRRALDPVHNKVTVEMEAAVDGGGQESVGG